MQQNTDQKNPQIRTFCTQCYRFISDQHCPTLYLIKRSGNRTFLIFLGDINRKHLLEIGEEKLIYLKKNHKHTKHPGEFVQDSQK